MADLDINLKFEAERLSVSGERLLDVAKRLALIVDDPNKWNVPKELEVQVQNILGVANDVSTSAARLVGRA